VVGSVDETQGKNAQPLTNDPQATRVVVQLFIVTLLVLNWSYPMKRILGGLTAMSLATSLSLGCAEPAATPPAPPAPAVEIPAEGDTAPAAEKPADAPAMEAPATEAPAAETPPAEEKPAE